MWKLKIRTKLKIMHKGFSGSPNFVKRFIPKHSTLKSTHTSLVENKNSMNSDACLSCFDKSKYSA